MSLSPILLSAVLRPVVLVWERLQYSKAQSQEGSGAEDVLSPETATKLVYSLPAP